MAEQLTFNGPVEPDQPQGPPPPLTGLDAFRVLFTSPDGGLHEAPAISRRAVPRIVAKFQEAGYTFLRAERKAEGLVGSDWPWQPLHEGVTG